MTRFFACCCLFFATLSASAGAFSEIDIIVREAVGNAYNDEISTSEDIWDLDLVENYQMDCLAMVTGLAMKPDTKTATANPTRFWVCISKSASGSLEALSAGDQNLAEEPRPPAINFKPE